VLPESGVGAPRAGDAGIAGAPDRPAGRAGARQPAALQQACAGVLPELKPMLRALLHYHLGTPLLRTASELDDRRCRISTR
jgi:DNA repair protein RecO (recombination protein O)